MAKSKNTQNATSEIMVVNDVPGEECRIAILSDGHLDELYAERTTTATSVGNIYKGRVTNVEPAIQAAFIDYGQSRSGFLHISDLHPRYFPGGGRTERVGKKIPRRERPPIQEALKRGDELLVQVLKEGVGTKGPTLTSYLSIPGRLLVMMPEMDRVGVSRKVEDPERRREMRDTLDSLDLPEGFGFILRTAGFGKGKTELNRDVAYLTRLWKVMAHRIEHVGAPCELYTESDLLIRTIRDILRTSISAIIVDSESAHQRASAFLGVVAPRSAPKLLRYRQASPIFHAFDIERQIELIHSREVPLPSGGKLVIDQTEALVAIDVNSGRSRSARDSETNAFQTNREAADEICRQLRLRDLGGLVIHDLIDMHMMRHRREIEERFRENAKRDRAKSTMLRISEFGILEMTRQRMRPSLRKTHFMECPTCTGRGEIKAPESVGGDTLRQIGYLLQFDRVHRVEAACSSRVATVLLSAKRRQLVAMEDASGKRIDVRISDSIAIDRVDLYAYDERNADIDIDKLPSLTPPTLAQLEKAQDAAEPASEDKSTKKKRKRRRRRGAGPADATAIALAGGFEVEAESTTEPDAAAAEDDDSVAGARKKRKKRGRRGGRRKSSEAKKAVDESTALEAEPTDDVQPIRVHVLARQLGVQSRAILDHCRDDGVSDLKNHMSSIPAQAVARIRGAFATDAAEADVDATRSDAQDDQPPAKRRGRRRRRQSSAKTETAPEPQTPASDAGVEESTGAKKPSRRRRSRRRRKADSAAPDPAVNGTPTSGGASDEDAVASPEAETRPAKKRRSRRKTSAKSTAAASNDSNEQLARPADNTPAVKAKTRRRSLYRNRVSSSRPNRAATTAKDRDE